MENEFKDYYKTVQEHAKDLVSDVYDDLIDELKESHYSIKLETLLSWKEREISEYNNGLYISLREAVEILEQSVRLVDDSSMYVNSGDCREQVKSMAYWTYRNDLYAEFILQLRSKFETDLVEFNANLDKLEEELEEICELIDEKENEISEVEIELQDCEDSQKTKKMEKLLQTLQIDLENLKNVEDKLEYEMEEPHNLVENIERILGKR